jgi:hypothetical protein
MTDGNESDFEPTDESILYAQELVSEHLNRQLGWITELDHKAASLISVNGIVLALEVPLVVFLLKIIDTDIKIPYIIIIWTLFLPQLVCFIISLIFSYKGHKIKSFEIPSNNTLVEDIFNGLKFKDKRSAVIQNIGNIQKSSLHIDEIQEFKANNVKISQLFFIVGAILLAILLCGLIVVGIIY